MTAPEPCVVCSRRTTQRSQSGIPTCSTACRSQLSIMTSDSECAEHGSAAMGHCCFAGCSPMPCGCCRNAGPFFSTERPTPESASTPVLDYRNTVHGLWCPAKEIFVHADGIAGFDHDSYSQCGLDFDQHPRAVLTNHSTVHLPDVAGAPDHDDSPESGAS